MSLFALSDTHLSLSTDKPMDIFGSRWQQHDKRISEAWTETVGDGDTVVIAGDISWAMSMDDALTDLAYLDRLPGRKLIGRGNHDYWWGTVNKMKKFFVEQHGLSTLDFLYNNAFEVGEFIVCGSRGWWGDEGLCPSGVDSGKIVAREALRVGLSLDAGERLRAEAHERGEERELLVFLHFPPAFRDYRCEEIISVLRQHGVKRCFYGHIHNSYDIPPAFGEGGIEYSITSADYLKFRPLLIEKCAAAPEKSIFPPCEGEIR